MPLNKNALIRIKFLDEILTGGRKYGFDELLDRLNEHLSERGMSEGVSERTLRNDIAFLREHFNAPLEYDRNSKSYHYSDPEFSAFNQELTVEALEAILKATDILRPFRGLSTTDMLYNILNSASKASEIGYKFIVFPYLEIDHNPLYKGLRWMSTLYNAIENNQKVWIDYDSFTGEWDFESIVRPYYLKEYNNRWFLIGKVEDVDESFWTIPLDRINSVKILDDVYLPEEKNAFLEKFNEIIGVTYIDENPLQAIKLFFREPAMKYVLTKPLHPSQKILEQKESSVLLRIQVRENYELLQSILQYVPNVKVVEPIELHWKLMDMLKEGLEFMKKPIEK